MTPQSPKAMTADQIAEEIFLHCNWVIAADAPKARAYIAEQIKLAMEQAREEGLVRGFDKGFHNGQVAMRERAADRVEELAEGESNHFISEKVRALHPHAPEEKK